MTISTPPVTLDDVRDAADRLKGVAHRTPVLRSRTLDALVGAEVFLKCENFQRVGAFKFRGAYNAASRLTSEQLAKGIAAYSSGNHAQAVALAARELGSTAVIVMTTGWTLADPIIAPLASVSGLIVQPASPTDTEQQPEQAALFLLHAGCLVGPQLLSTLGVRAVREQTSVGSSLFAQPLMLAAARLTWDKPLMHDKAELWSNQEPFPPSRGFPASDPPSRLLRCRI